MHSGTVGTERELTEPVITVIVIEEREREVRCQRGERKRRSDREVDMRREMRREMEMRREKDI